MTTKTPPILFGHHKTVQEMLAAWDNGDTIWTVECGGLGPGYEQALQIAAVEFARACKDLTGLKNHHKPSSDKFTKCCEERLREIDNGLLGLSGAQFGAARWLAWEWCVNGGPAKLQERCKQQGEEDRQIQVSKSFPKAP